jgi:hypothetical protein
VSAGVGCTSSIPLTRRNALLGSAALAATLLGQPWSTRTAGAQALSAEEARAIAKEAYIYGFPLVDSYRVQYSYFVDTENPEYKGGWNEIHNTARVFTPDDKAIQTPNSDTPYSFVGADLRAEPLVLTVPEVDEGRYYSLQFIDMYTFNFAYVGSRATGNGAGSFLLAGPGWNGEKPAGVKDVINCETELAFLLYRTQLFGPDDIDNVKKIQAGFKVEPLSSFLGQPAPAAAAAIDFMTPLTPDEQKTSPKFFDELNFVLQFCPAVPAETELRARFAGLGIEAGKPFDPDALPPETRGAVEAGMADAWAAFKQFKETELDTGRKSSADGFGTRAFLNGDYLARMSSAVLGIYGNSKDEALYPVYFVDADNKPLDGSTSYRLRFAPDELPPVNAFWSLTMYKLPESLLSANKLARYLINSPMLRDLKKDAVGGLTLYVQHESPGAEKEANWLPAPSGPFFMVMRLYWPKPEALDGRWKTPQLTRVS